MQQQQVAVVSASGQPYVQPASGPVVGRQSNFVQKYMCYRRLSIGLGITLIVAAVLSFAFNIVDLVIGYRPYQNPESVISTTTTTMLPYYSDYYNPYSGSSSYKYNYYYDYYYPNYFTWGSVGHGFWVGIMCMIAGGFGIGAGLRRTKCQITAFNVLCIIAASLTIGQLVTGILGAVFSANSLNCDLSGYNKPRQDFVNQQTCERRPVLIAMEALLACLAIVEAVAAIWGSVICCKAYCCCGNCCSCCCCCETTPDYRVQQVMYNGIPMMVITANQQSSMPVMYPVQSYPQVQPVQNSYSINQPSTQIQALPPAYLSPTQPVDAGQFQAGVYGYSNPLNTPTSSVASVVTYDNQKQAKY